MMMFRIDNMAAGALSVEMMARFMGVSARNDCKRASITASAPPQTAGNQKKRMMSPSRLKARKLPTPPV